jgi:hypothetical protein
MNKRNYVLLSLTDMRAYPQEMIGVLKGHTWQVILLPKKEEEDSSSSLKDFNF